MSEIIKMPVPELTPEQRQHWHERAAYWGEHEEINQRALEYSQRQRRAALEMLGMLPVAQVVKLRSVDGEES